MTRMSGTDTSFDCRGPENLESLVEGLPLDAPWAGEVGVGGAGRGSVNLSMKSGAKDGMEALIARVPPK